MSAAIRYMQELVQACEDNDDAETLNQISLQLLDELAILTKGPNTKDEKLLAAMHSNGVKLWNLIVAKKTGKKAVQLVCARVRHVSLHLTYMATFQDKSQTTARKQQAMAMKTGRDWLDCNNANMADKCFILATECYVKLQKLVDDKESSHQIHLTKDQLDECHQNMLKVYAFRAEVALGQSQHSTSLEFLNKAKELLQKFGKQGDFLCSICYNFGLDCYQKELYSFSTEWLRESLEIGNNESSIKTERQATTRQLLAMVYLNLKGEENYKKAIDIIETSILEQPHVKSHFLKLKIVLLLNENDETVLKVFNDISLHPMLDIDLALQCISLFTENKRKQLSYEGLEILNKKYPRLNINIKVQLKKLELLISDSCMDLAKEVIEAEFIRANNHGTRFDKNCLKQLQLLLWECAQHAYEANDFTGALQWYNYSLQFMKQCSNDHINLAKLQRNRCSCLIELQKLKEAAAAAAEALAYDENSAQGHFLLFKCSLLMNDEEKALQSVEKLSEISTENRDSETVQGLVCLAAQLAFENGSQKISELALEKIIVQLNDPKQILISIRCLTRLKFTYLSENSKQEEIQTVLQLVQKARNILQEIKNESTYGVHDEILWFNKIAWNVALSCTELFLEMQQAFLLCYELSLLLSGEEQNLTQQKTCLLMSAGCGLQVCRGLASNKEMKKEKLLEVLGLVEQCHMVSEKLSGTQDSTTCFLLTYAFEAKVGLEHTDFEDLFEKTLSLTSSSQPKPFEKFANIALSQPKTMNEVGLKSLKLAIKCHLEQPTVDYLSLSKAIHSLINVSLHKGSATNAESKEDAYNFYQDAMKLIDPLAKGDYPEMELVWLMTKAWNCGIHLYSAHHYDAAQKWCSLSMKFLKHLSELKSNYEPHMSNVFTDIVSRIQQAKVCMQMEE